MKIERDHIAVEIDDLAEMLELVNQNETLYHSAHLKAVQHLQKVGRQILSATGFHGHTHEFVFAEPGLASVDSLAQAVALTVPITDVAGIENPPVAFDFSETSQLAHFYREKAIRLEDAAEVAFEQLKVLDPSISAWHLYRQADVEIATLPVLNPDGSMNIQAEKIHQRKLTFLGNKALAMRYENYVDQLTVLPLANNVPTDR